jgi:hypothetical protein
MDHSSALKGVIDAIGVLATNACEDEVVLLLQQKGYSRIEAEKLNVFVPSAFSWIVLKRLGVTSLPNHFVAKDACNNEVEIPISSQHYFTAALTLAYSTFENGWSNTVSRKTYEAVAARSAEMDIVNKVLDQGGSVDGSTLSPLQLHRISAEEALEN